MAAALTPSHTSAEPFATVLWVGHGLTPEIRDALRARGLGILVAETPERAFRLLHAFRVAAVVCDGPQFPVARALAELNPPVVLLGRSPERWSEGGVLQLTREHPAPELAAAIRGAIGTHGHPPKSPHRGGDRRAHAHPPPAALTADIEPDATTAGV